MEIKYKLYPYPVLSSYSDDYKTGSFDATIDVVRDGYNYRLDFLATLTCQSLLERIKNGDAKYVYHLECAQTGFRTVIQTDQLSETYTLFSQTVNGKLQICPFVVAVKDLNGYSSSDFHDDYQGEVFDIEAGCVLAVGKMVVLDITKNTDLYRIPFGRVNATRSISALIRNVGISSSAARVSACHSSHEGFPFLSR